MLKGQLARLTDIDVTFVSEPSAIGENIQRSIKKKISDSSMMIVLLGESWSRWQEYELNNALESKVPVVGLILTENNILTSQIISLENVPIVNWNWNEISQILSGKAHTLDYKPKDPEQLESPIIQLGFSKISEELTAHLLRNPKTMFDMSPRKFEELVAYIMEKHGYKVTLTQQSRDGGIDIFALKNEGFGNILTIVKVDGAIAYDPSGSDRPTYYGHVLRTDVSPDKIAIYVQLFFGHDYTPNLYRVNISDKKPAIFLPSEEFGHYYRYLRTGKTDSI